MRVATAARIDFGGGWTDTPPFSIERGGMVLNAAVTLRGEHPIVAEGTWLAEPRLVLESRDIDIQLEPTLAGEVLAYANPADPFALLKAALVLQGIVPAHTPPEKPIASVMREWGGGLHMATQTSIPRGSGLGTSSIMAGAVLACLGKLLDETADERRRTDDERLLAVESSAPSFTELFDEVLVLEQMLTTGGGWQDQVGGLVGGIKMATTGPGLPQRIRVESLYLTHETQAELADRLLMVYTGQQRLAKNLLRAVMGRWMARDPEMVWLLAEIARLAASMQDALKGDDVSGFGVLLGEHWKLNKRMDPGCSNPFIDGLFDVMAPYICGGKLAGAGGGGFAFAVARDAAAATEMSAALGRAYPGTPVAVWPSAIPDEGMQFTASVTAQSLSEIGQDS
jgi:fucokinase